MKKKSLVGWTYKTWEQGFNQYACEIKIPQIVVRKGYFDKPVTKVRITIKEIR